VSLAQDASLAQWCQDSPLWKGPYGDKCTAYRVGGDRNFWSLTPSCSSFPSLSFSSRTLSRYRLPPLALAHAHGGWQGTGDSCVIYQGVNGCRCEWDGADSPAACPYSCGTCTLKMKAQYMAANAKPELAQRQSQAIHQAQHPHSRATAMASTWAGAQSRQHRVKEAPAQMLAQDTRAAKKSRIALEKEVAALKGRLTAIAKATGYNLKHGGGKSGGAAMSSKAAAQDLDSFYGKLTSTRGSSDGTTRVINTSRDARRKLGEFFDSLPTGKRPKRALAPRLPKGARTMSAYTKEYVGDVQKTYGKLAAQQLVLAAQDGTKAYHDRKQGRGSASSLCPTLCQDLRHHRSFDTYTKPLTSDSMQAYASAYAI
jgi:hypothetical protein